MPLQIRRGTEAERQAMTQPLASGELLFVTNSGSERLYIGNGTTLGGVQITGYTDNDAKDAAAAIFTGGTHDGISFAYNTITNTISATVDLSSYTGLVDADLKGSVFGDDSTPLVDGLNSSINLDGTVKGNIIPNANETYDLGSSSYRFKDLYLSGSSIKLGSATITATGSSVDLPAGSTIAGVPISDFGVGQNLNVNVIGDDSTVLVNVSTNTIQGTHKGNIKASDDSTAYNASTKTLTASTLAVGPYLSLAGTSGITGSPPILTTTNPGTNVMIFDGVSLDVQTNTGSTEAGISITGITTGSATTSIMGLYGSRGTTTSPTTLNSGDLYSGYIFAGHNGTEYVPGVAMLSQVTGAPNSSNPSIPGKFIIAVADGTNDIFVVNKQITFDSTGTFAAPIMKVGSYDNSGESAITGAIGMIIYNTTTNKFRGYSNTGWVDLS